jgi:hypothetical protein
MGEAAYDDHRRNRRYAIKGDVFIGSRPLFHTVGSLRDISNGGVGFEYVSDSQNGPPETVEVDIFCGKQIRLSRVPCRVAYDIGVDQPYSGGVGARRCGLEFGRLSDQQAALLSLIVNS